MFDERSEKWIRIYKGITVAFFWICVVGGVLGGIGDATASFLDFGLGGDDDGFLDLIVWVLGIGGFGCIQLVANMLIIQLLNNVQIIREKIENQ